MNTKIITIAVLVILAVVLFSFQNRPAPAPPAKRGMIKVTILYPNAEGKNFDMDYYSSKHMPLVERLLGDSLKLYEIDKGVGGRAPNDPIPYLAIGYLYFDRLSAYRNSFGPHAQEIINDIPNYTNIQPIVQISEVIQ